MAASLHIDKFSGLATTDPSRFLDDFAAYCALNNLHNDSQITAAFTLHLCDGARSWHDDLQPQVQKVWNRLRQAFVDRYVCRNPLNAPDYFNEEQIFKQLVLMPGTSIVDYYNSLKDKCRMLNKNDNDLMSQFISGLPPQLAFFVRASNPQESCAALYQARIGETHGYRASIPTQNNVRFEVAATSNSPQPSMDEIVQKLDVLTESLARLQARSRSPAHPVDHRPPGQRSSQRSATNCANCGLNNHTTANCRRRNNAITCYRCGRVGHAARNCRMGLNA